MRKSNGFTLLEVLVGLFLLSVVMLGMMAAQVKKLHDLRGIYYFQYAEGLAENMTEYIVSHHGDKAGYYQEWLNVIKHQFPSAIGKVEGKFPDVLVSIRWGDSRTCSQSHAGLSGCVIIKS